MASQVIGVIGSTGAQGFSVVQSLLEQFPVRAFTRTPEKLQQLTSNPNFSAVQLDPADHAAVKASLKGVWALFVNTFSDYTQPIGAEERQGKAIVDAAVEAGVEWLVYSALPENMPFRAFEEKAKVMKYAREVGKTSNLKPIFVQLGYYMSNFVFSKPVLNPSDGFVEFRWPVLDAQTYFPLIATQSDLGPIVKAVFQNLEEYKGVEIPIVGETLTLTQVAEIYGKVYNVPTRAVYLPGAPAQELFPGWTQMHAAFKTDGYFPAYKGREGEISQKVKKLYPGVKTWEAWLKEVGLEYVKN
ncbi:hypothetical protein EUX98_g6189 [Antrodiella citrinella]|uniref:NmrA-like domain-containing protein n=1 Tax=Antrodiella citrinella TaxID=2447956 RepID=A0A4S4MPX0_9APHY|nr:hypothetical protein EUX98_g6189 [Antrodiella citrinella]